MRIFYLIILLILSPISLKAELLKPDPSIMPDEVILIQLLALQKNDIPYDNAGIAQTWEFAHPINKASTGPLEKFKEMIYSKSYKILISHENSESLVLKETSDKFIFKVYVLSKEKKKY